MQAVWGSETPGIDEHTAPKRQRLFIARQACESCRQKKTRCDGGNPCGLCRSAGIECRFAERKATKNEVSLGMIFNTLQRIESKIETHQEQKQLQQQLKQGRNGSAAMLVEGELPSELSPRRPSSTAATELASPQASSSLYSPHCHETPYRHASGIYELLSATGTPPGQVSDINHHDGNSSILSPSSLPPPPFRSRSPRHVPVIQYPIRQLTSWPAVRVLLEEAAAKAGDDFTYDAAVATMLEQRRPPLPLPSPSLMLLQSNWLAQIHVSVVKDLGDKYFATFNLGNPILDRRLFSQHSLAVALQTEFGVNIESCVVLATMALGALGRKALVQTGLDTVTETAAAAAITTSIVPPPDATRPFGEGGWDVWEDGLVFFNEARKRIGLLGCDNSLQACQYYLLTGLFYSQLLRPVDFWASCSHPDASDSLPKDCDDWTMDMQARLFWTSAMFEAVLTQELDLPVSSLLTYEDRVPLPRFVEFPGVASVVSSLVVAAPPLSAATAREAEQDSFCHYHFLSQIAHRIILTRLCDSLFANRSRALASRAAADGATTMTRNDYPPQALEDELLHQLEQWRSQLPDNLKWRTDSVNLDGSADSLALTPADALVVPWLRARYYIARYHLRRPLLHRALHHPNWMTRDDFDKCRDAIVCAVDWLTVIQPALLAMDCLHLKFFVCTQLFGQLLLLHALESSSVPELPQLVPTNYATWRMLAFRFLEQCAPHSPSIAREYEIVSAVHDIKNRIGNDCSGNGNGNGGGHNIA
ncbi:c6 zinc finger domain containing protein [Grosmannia clavigera kw1407]|uniref:C6 zinc finger domain containing protein n=1 Tax=Grosmannia clavigera (strain kw1407 / UAMH 11150) TaxID=655863 RepID=F0XV73_GROCL|nr:c6 zinc finger domain containing protein [Grosmannia clavigera kw1407]EFW98986.1 c6 zinc finger domain containing protein [Grosmannia clavigera kw1407]